MNLQLIVIPLIVFTAAFVYVLYPQYLTWRWGNASKKWPLMRGTILYSGIQKYGGKGGPTYQPKIQYEYTVGDVTFKGSRIEFGLRLNTNEAEARRISEKYVVGKKISVFYHPAHPSLSTLQTGVDEITLGCGFVICGIIFIFIFVWLYVLVKFL